jgi:rhodanese-related sulfurtransferase
MKSTTIREALVIITISAGLGLAYNAFFANKPIAWVYTPPPVSTVDTSTFNNIIGDTYKPASYADKAIANIDSALSQSRKDSIALALAMTEKLKRDSLKKLDKNIKDSLAKLTKLKDSSLKRTSGQLPPNNDLTPKETTPAVKLPIAVTYEQVVKMQSMPNVKFIDARKKEEHDKGHISGSLHVDIQQFQANPAEQGNYMRMLYGLPKDQPVVAYCGGGACELSHELCDVLVQIGFKKVFIYLGGWEEYSKKKSGK